MLSARREDDSCWLPIDGVPGAYLLAQVGRKRPVLSTLWDVMPSPGLVALVVLTVVAIPFLVIFAIASVWAMFAGGLGW